MEGYRQSCRGSTLRRSKKDPGLFKREGHVERVGSGKEPVQNRRFMKALAEGYEGTISADQVALLNGKIFPKSAGKWTPTATSRKGKGVYIGAQTVGGFSKIAAK